MCVCVCVCVCVFVCMCVRVCVYVCVLCVLPIILVINSYHVTLNSKVVKYRHLNPDDITHDLLVFTDACLRVW